MTEHNLQLYTFYLAICGVTLSLISTLIACIGLYFSNKRKKTFYFDEKMLCETHHFEIKITPLCDEVIEGVTFKSNVQGLSYPHCALRSIGREDSPETFSIGLIENSTKAGFQKFLELNPKIIIDVVVKCRFGVKQSKRYVYQHKV